MKNSKEETEYPKIFDGRITTIIGKQERVTDEKSTLGNCINSVNKNVRQRP